MIEYAHADVLEWARCYEGEPFHALLCDPPYHLTSIVNRFKNEEPAHTKTAKDIANRSTPIARLARGFMGKTWDGGDVAFQPETWAALAQHLYPGAFGFAFCDAARGHRMACAIEDAGMIMHPKIFCYVHGQGFPKATRIDTQIDKEAGEEVAHGKAFNTAGSGEREEEFMANGRTAVRHEAKSDLARAWEGHRYGRQAMKPAVEQIILFQKPYKGNPLDCITRTGAGAINIDAGRIGMNGSETHSANAWGGKVYGEYGAKEKVIHNKGRWPANFCTVGECAAAALDRPSRFFFHAVADALDAADPVRYTAKAARSERDEGIKEAPDVGGRFAGTSNQEAFARNTHPTCKPISLCKWLALLLLPPAEYAPRRILIPFAGSGSESIAAHLAGWDCVLGIEKEAEYIRLAEARAKHWQQQGLLPL